ncbi:DUF1735 domain-containing protein [Leeuwenhoekiella parthenopeia]|uniref:DUF1735 domain-containing protein n=1 Tax=Leeuwenhoekiella parthenopeia TaxID=2890320 RepID=A0ABS8GRR1_9FLAO|nr:DUF1735 domain-containing protein [Leeuwenhoekiella parthenopeia]MCC4211268.1 DUF1735 domain-containing protein [Leeuwenhoekiella parthenopeia]
MKNLTLKLFSIRLCSLLLLACITLGCENQEQDFDDFEIQNVYFPIKYPIRTISLQEDSRIDNSIDLERSFNIGVAIGGLRSNERNRVINIALAPELVNDAFFADDERPVQLMPSSYYTLASNSEVTIPSGSFSGLLRVSLTDEFFNDPLALSANYVIPLKIEPGDYDVLDGMPLDEVTDPDPRSSDDYQVNQEPRNFTLFAVKYINKYHGVYLQKGADVTLDATGSPTDTVIYNTEDLVRNILTEVFTTSLTSVATNRIGNNTGAGEYGLNLVINGNSISITGREDSDLNIEGSGTFLTRDDQGAEIWGEESRKTMFLEYTYTDTNGANHRVNDTLVFRNDDLRFEEFNIILSED